MFLFSINVHTDTQNEPSDTEDTNEPWQVVQTLKSRRDSQHKGARRRNNAHSGAVLRGSGDSSERSGGAGRGGAGRCGALQGGDQPLGNGCSEPGHGFAGR